MRVRDHGIGPFDPGPSQANATADLGLVMLFDGVCNLCNASVSFYLRRDRVGAIRFAAMQSPAGRMLLTDLGLPLSDFETLVVLDHGHLRVKSDATLRLLCALPMPWPWLARVSALVPAPLRDWIYDRIASNRYRLAGRRAACRLPAPGERARFLT